MTESNELFFAYIRKTQFSVWLGRVQVFVKIRNRSSTFMNSSNIGCSECTLDNNCPELGFMCIFTSCKLIN